MKEQPVCYDDGMIKYWYLQSKGETYWHREDGPAFEDIDGSRHWWINDVQLPAKEVETWLEENKVDLKTNEGQMALILRWA